MSRRAGERVAEGKGPAGFLAAGRSRGHLSKSHLAKLTPQPKRVGQKVSGKAPAGQDPPPARCRDPQWPPPQTNREQPRATASNREQPRATASNREQPRATASDREQPYCDA